LAFPFEKLGFEKSTLKECCMPQRTEVVRDLSGIGTAPYSFACGKLDQRA
jgi:hypothetical protein